MSDSESSEEIEVKVELEHTAKVRQLIEKGKEILPFYSEESLYQIYKQCYQSENVYLNKLNILAKQRLSQQENDEEWIVEKKYEKQIPLKKQGFQENKVKRQKYNFLEDTKLIQRALKYKRQDREYPKKTQQQYQQKPSEIKEAPRQKVQYKQKPNQTYQAKKILYKEKEEVQAPKKQIESVPAPTPIPQAQPQAQPQVKPVEAKKQINESNTKKQVKPVAQKKLKYTEKKQPPKPEVKQQQKVQPQPQVKVQQQPATKPLQQAVTKPKEESVPKPKQQEKVQQKVQPIQTKNEIEKIVIKPKIQPLPIQEQKKENIIESVVSNTSIASSVEEGKTESIKRIQRVKEPIAIQVQKQFERTTSQNSFILSFIKPSNKLQQISYIRYPDGKIKDVKVKEPLTKKN